MSSWKHYGGKNSYEGGRINTDSLTVNTLVIKDAYEGDLYMNGNLTLKNLDIVQSLDVNQHLNVGENVFIGGNTTVKGNMVIGSGINNLLKLNCTVEFIKFDFNVEDTLFTGNLATKGNIIANNYAFIGGNIIYFGPDSSHTIINNSVGMGINTLAPSAGLHLVTDNSTGLKIKSSQDNVESILVENQIGTAVKTFAYMPASDDYYSAGIEMFDATRNKVVGNIYIQSDKLYIRDTSYVDVFNKMVMDSSYVNLMNRLVVSPDSSEFDRSRDETLSVYCSKRDSTPFYENIYQINRNNKIYNSPAVTIQPNINDSDDGMATLTIDSSTHRLSMVGGTYAGDRSRAMGMFQLNDLTPSLVMVSGSSSQKYLSTTGINTFIPKTDSHVLHVNGPVHINNNDISAIYNTDFEICSMCHSKNNRGFIVAIGNKRVDGLGIRNQFLHSNNYGANWTTIDITSMVNIAGVKITSVYSYNSDNIFITGEQNTLLYGNTVQFNTVSGLNIASIPTFNHIFINPIQPAVNKLRGYFSIDLSSALVMFDINMGASTVSSVQTLSLDRNNSDLKARITHIYSIQAYDNRIYIGGVDDIGFGTIQPNGSDAYDVPISSAVIITCNSNIHTPISPPVVESRFEHKYNIDAASQAYRYTINDIQVFDNSYAVGVGNGITAFTKNGGQNWFYRDWAWNDDVTKPRIDISLNSCFIINETSVIAVGTNASSYRTDPSWNMLNNIYTTTDRFASTIPADLQQTPYIRYWEPMPDRFIDSSGKRELILSNTTFKKVLVLDKQNVLILNTSSPFTPSNSGSSILYNIFTPTYLNNADNVLDIYGPVSVVSDIKLSGDLVSTNTTESSTINVFNGTIRNIRFGGDADISIGNIYGNTNINSKLYLNEKVSIMNTENSISQTTGALCVSGGMGIAGNIYGGNIILSGRLYDTSDYRIKSGVISLHDISYNVDDLNPIYYLNKNTKRHDMGFLAHEMQTIYPFLVNGKKDGESLQSIHYSGLIAVLVKEVQELKKENAKIRERLSHLEL